MAKSLVEHDLQVISTWKDVQVIEMNVQKDYILCSIPPKLPVSEFMGVLKGKVAQDVSWFKTKALLAIIFGFKDLNQGFKNWRKAADKYESSQIYRCSQAI